MVFILLYAILMGLDQNIRQVQDFVGPAAEKSAAVSSH